MASRLIGVIEGEQLDGKKKIRNDRLVAVANANHMYANVTRGQNFLESEDALFWVERKFIAARGRRFNNDLQKIVLCCGLQFWLD